jgi:hypothetical protein
MGDLFTELADDQAISCLVCQYLHLLGPAEQVEWNDAFQSSSKVISNASLWRALDRRKVGGGITSVGRHRRNKHGSR